MLGRSGSNNMRDHLMVWVERQTRVHFNLLFSERGRTIRLKRSPPKEKCWMPLVPFNSGHEISSVCQAHICKDAIAWSIGSAEGGRRNIRADKHCASQLEFEVSN